MSDEPDEKIKKNKVGLLKLAEMLGSVSEACEVSLLATPSPSFASRSGLLLLRP